MNTPEGKSPAVWCRGLADLNSFDYEACLVANEAAYANVKLELDLKKALEDADLVIESLAEDTAAKIAFYETAAPLMPKKTVIVTNSSTLLPSTFAASTGRPEKYLALHFANRIWFGNTAEIMSHSKTDEVYYQQVVEFAKEIGMIPLCLHKEQPGYILNTMLVPLLTSAMALWATEVSDPATIDLTWKCATGAPRGPFQIIDTVGLVTAHNITVMNPKASDPASAEAQIVRKLKAMIDEGKTGKAAGEGFYKY